MLCQSQSNVRAAAPARAPANRIFGGGDERRPKSDKWGAKTAERQQLDPKDFELAKAIRSEVFGYVTRGALLAVTPVLGFIGFVLWGYIEWRLPQIAGGVPKNAVVAFAQGSCPEGWTYFVRARSHVIVGSEPDSESPNDTYQLLDHSGELAEYVFTKAVPREGRQLAANELPVKVPGFLALTYCDKRNER
jgi:hypothetical protein